MRALPAVLLSTYVFLPLLTMAPRPFGWADAPAALRMGECAHMFISLSSLRLSRFEEKRLKVSRQRCCQGNQ